MADMAGDYLWANLGIGNRHRGEIGSSGYRQRLTSGSGEVFVWGSNSSHQLAKGTQEKVMNPIHVDVFSFVQQAGLIAVISAHEPSRILPQEIAIPLMYCYR